MSAPPTTTPDPAAITAARLQAVAPKASTAHVTLYAPVLDAARAAGDITTPLRVAHWIAQILQETGSLGRLSENLIYSKPAGLFGAFSKTLGTLERASQIVAKASASKPYDQAYVANIVYANKIGNGDEASGDGYRYRGRGFLQLTGRANYRALEKVTGLKLEDNPDLAADPATAARIAALYWKSAKCNTYADADDIKKVTAAVNGAGLLGLEERTVFAQKGTQVWK